MGYWAISHTRHMRDSIRTQQFHKWKTTQYITWPVLRETTTGIRYVGWILEVQIRGGSQLALSEDTQSQASWTRARILNSGMHTTEYGKFVGRRGAPQGMKLGSASPRLYSASMLVQRHRGIIRCTSSRNNGGIVRVNKVSKYPLSRIYIGPDKENWKLTTQRTRQIRPSIDTMAYPENVGIKAMEIYVPAQVKSPH